MNLIKTFVKRPVTTTMVILIFISFGILSFTNLQIDMMPKMDIPVAIVSTTYQGAASEEMENLITKPLEGVLGSVAGIEDISSQSSNGSSVIILQFADGTDIDQAALDMREKVDLIKGALPTNANDPMVMKIDINSLSGSTTIGIKSKSGNLIELQNIVEDKIKGRLERQPGVASVSMAGGTSTEISVILNEDALRGFGISESQLLGILRAENINTPTGSVKQGNANLSLRVEGQFENIEDIKNLPITTATGQTIFFSDVATVEEITSDMTQYSYLDGEPAIILTVQKQSTANSVNVSDALIKELASISDQVEGVEIEMIMDPADYIRASIASVAQSAIYGLVFAVIVLFVFLKDVRTTLIVGVAMPVSIIMTFALMYFSGMTLNIMSLGGLTLGVGMLVDNSIVVIESIYRKLEQGESHFDAAVDGASEVAMSVIASTLTTIVVFLPITFAGGLTAQIFNQLSFTISFSLLSSLFVSLSFVPMMASLFLITEEEKLNTGIVYKILTKFNDGFSKLERGYKKVLGKALAHGKIVALLVLGFLVLTGLSITTIGAVFMPESDEGMLMITVDMPKGTVLEDTLQKSIEVNDMIKDTEEIENISATVGGGGMASLFGSSSSDTANLTVNLIPKADRKRSAKEIEVDFNKRFKNIAGAEVKASASQSSMGSYGGGGIDITIKGDELDELDKLVEDFSVMFEDIPGVEDITSSVEETSPQANIKIDRQRATSYGISASSVASIVATEVEGSVPTALKIVGDEIDINVSGDPNKFNYLDDIKNILIPTSTGVSIPLYEICDITISYPPVTITRQNQQRYVSLSVTTDGTASSEITKVFEEKLKTYIMPANYTWEYSGAQEQMNETFGSLLLALVMAILLVYMVMASEFESLLYPFIVLFSVPIAISGGIFGLAVAGQDISITSFLGMIMLAGLVINSAIVLIDYTNLLIKRDGLTVDEALLKAGPVRLRPIVMSVLTTTLGLLPMAVSKAEGAEMMNGLATIVIFGLLFSTIVTLIFVPVVYKAFTTRATKRKAKKAAKKAKKIEKYNKIKKEKNMDIPNDTNNQEALVSDTKTDEIEKTTEVSEEIPVEDETNDK